ncbi:hypothetical protein LB572_12215 [Mesorhizobium sp. BH1-1-5]|uniref:hypothetical protein n=1 Tax=Mesorhizobium sp. BH1-1-5 TaxID=2876661 RepID=UPI001CCD84A1|nr:hypothetical protein [Mesorhizobium sp. BH1-1-5]MBZ9987860.1 hypothetical protein [Mesorhizobium sp. BH1-1-5]
MTTAIITLVTAIAGMRPASAQSVSGTGDLSPDASTIQTPDWTVGADLVVGNIATGTLDIQNGGAVTNDTGFIGYGAQGTVTVSGTDGGGNASTWTNNGDLVVGQDGNGTLNIGNGGQVSNADGYIGVAAATQSDVTV